jgi:hypothetical protein
MSPYCEDDCSQAANLGEIKIFKPKGDINGTLNCCVDYYAKMFLSRPSRHNAPHAKLNISFRNGKVQFGEQYNRLN